MTEQRILDYITKYIPLTEEEKAAVLKETPYKTFSKGTHVLRQGQVSRECYFVVQGLVRQYELVDGEEKTTYFYSEGEAIVAFDSASKKVPCLFNWVCEEETMLVIGRLDQIDEAYARNPKLEKMSGLFIRAEFGKYQNLSATFITLTPEQRYVQLLEQRPDLIHRVPQYHVASYLGIKPETLSRIRKRIAQKN
ncbi:cAMP-binding domain of CRP or a regulatory subunit of cAMP-dependent protein kinases [Catalinimonas alkaloidigena]|uniref:cAMP-binding domain of CRP or a regulatory subunit of cAMP-dependent protein kinases n=1 Tax=Catalinimonas alkaloidigena TaxID=1075417 RepID=A0A1G8X2N8_9BACT|nr:Crp/Fnr family transcriptional regulator [Catalinimonas alkaloidigena]SDJ84872.1 cAMP-binding domain of CRP or a regulatory subunit of cAMP-dependent protein kinases [Catalinimonas alkaloidigena]